MLCGIDNDTRVRLKLRRFHTVEKFFAINAKSRIKNINVVKAHIAEVGINNVLQICRTGECDFGRLNAAFLAIAVNNACVLGYRKKNRVCDFRHSIKSFH